ncbi:hypothetical protein [Bacteroides acidifaciens]|uniref:hypothetical protein n=1 Tax=Bacteroides acidifaciens TaxID=85831 RepID=UPI0024323311|nr:hypothetical protein [Bacteroides acidifaciens]
MKIKELKKKEALCEAINMKFDEANELFEAETLQSMQMAQISGGATGAPATTFWKIIDAIGKGTYALDTIKSAFDSAADFLNGWRTIVGSTPPPGNPTVVIDVTEQGGVSMKVYGAADSIFISKDGEIKLYGPTPITNSGSNPNNGSTDMP